MESAPAELLPTLAKTAQGWGTPVGTVQARKETMGHAAVVRWSEKFRL